MSFFNVDNLCIVEWPAYWGKDEQAVKSNTAWAVGERMPDGHVRVLIPVASGRERVEELIANPVQIENAMTHNCHGSFVSRALKVDFMRDGGPGQPQTPATVPGDGRPVAPHTPPRPDPIQKKGLGAAYTAAQAKVAATTKPAPKAPRVAPPSLF